MVPELEPINVVEDIFSKFEKISKNIKVVRLAPFDRSDSSAIIKGIKEAGKIMKKKRLQSILFMNYTFLFLHLRAV